MVHVKKCPLEKRGKPTTEFYVNGKPQVYCEGWLDSLTDEPLEECKQCLDYVNGKQCDIDFYSQEVDDDEITISKCLEVLEEAREDCESDIPVLLKNSIPAVILDAIIGYLRDYEEIETEKSFRDFPEGEH